MLGKKEFINQPTTHSVNNINHQLKIQHNLIHDRNKFKRNNIVNIIQNEWNKEGNKITFNGDSESRPMFK